MKKNTRKLLALLLSLVMLVSVLAGCGDGGNDGTTPSDGSTPGGESKPDDGTTPPSDGNEDLYLAGDPDKPITLNVFSQVANFSGKQGGWGAIVLRDKFGIELNFIPNTDGALETRMENGDLGDIVVLGDAGENFRKAVSQGLLFDWEDEGLLDDYAPNIKSTFPVALDAMKEVSGDGKLYGIHNEVALDDSDHADFSYTWELRWDLYKKLGYPEINTLDDLVEVLEDMHELDPTDDNGNPTYALSLWPDWDGDMSMYIKCLATGMTGYDGDKGAMGFYDPETGNFYGCLDDNSPYLQALKFANKLNQRGLLDPDSATNTWEKYTAKVQAGGTLFSIFNYAGSEQFNTPEHMAAGEFMTTIQPKAATNFVNGLSLSGSSYVVCIGSRTEYPEDILHFLDWLYTPEGMMTSLYGLQGLMWDYNEDGTTYFTDLGLKVANDPSYDLSGVEWTSPWTGRSYTLDGTFNDGHFQFNFNPWSLYAENPDSIEGETFNKTSWASYATDARCDMEQDWRDHMGYTNINEYLDDQKYILAPTVNYTASDMSKELQMTRSQVGTAIKQYTYQAMYAKTDAEFDALVAEMKDRCNEYGYDQCIEWAKNEAARLYQMQVDAGFSK